MADSSDMSQQRRWIATESSSPLAPASLAIDLEASAPPPFDMMLRRLRTLEPPCLPPIGSGAFDILFVSELEVCVWYAPARDGQPPREVIIPTPLLRAAWQALADAAATMQALDETTLITLATGIAGGRWLATLLTQMPGVRATEVVEGTLRLEWTALASVLPTPEQ